MRKTKAKKGNHAERKGWNFSKAGLKSKKQITQGSDI